MFSLNWLRVWELFTAFDGDIVNSLNDEFLIAEKLFTKCFQGFSKQLIVFILLKRIQFKTEIFSEQRKNWNDSKIVNIFPILETILSILKTFKVKSKKCFVV